MGSPQPKFDLVIWQKGGTSSFDQTCFAEYWSDLPRLVEEGMLVDPYNFRHRMALGKYLLMNTGDESIWGKDYVKHWYWAYLAQLDWQWRSGRFFSPTETVPPGKQEPVDAIATDSWWGYMNLGFSVGVYCGASKAGWVPSITLSNEQMDLDKDENFQACVDNWEEYFKGPHKDYVALKINLNEKPTAVFPLYHLLWPHHTTTIRACLSGAKAVEKLMPEEDRRFGLGWCRMVELLEAMSWAHLSLESLMQYGAGVLPCRRLDNNESLEWLKKHRDEEYKTCLDMFKLHESTDEDIEKMCSFWKSVAHYESVQRTLPAFLERLMHGSAFSKITAVSRLLFLYLRHRVSVCFASLRTYCIGRNQHSGISHEKTK